MFFANKFTCSGLHASLLDLGTQRRLYRRRHYRCVVNPGPQNNKPALFESRPNCLEFLALYIQIFHCITYVIPYPRVNRTYNMHDCVVASSQVEQSHDRYLFPTILGSIVCPFIDFLCNRRDKERDNIVVEYKPCTSDNELLQFITALLSILKLRFQEPRVIPFSKKGLNHIFWRNQKLSHHFNKKE